MSLILEALRKSEAERRRGLPPDLLHELPPPRPRARRVPAWAWPAAAVLAACVLAWGLWPRAVTRPPPVETQPSVPMATDPAPASSLPADTPPPSRSVPAPALPRATAPTPPLADTIRPTPVAPAPVDPNADAGMPIPASPPTAPPDPAPATTASTAPAGTPAGRVRLLSELDPATRKALPPLRLSMHMWNADPARRFAIIDGMRVVEGDRIGEASVARIESDGVLLEWQGSQVRIPLR